MGQVNTQKCVPNLFLTHDFHYLTQQELAGGRFLHIFSSYSFILQWLEIRFVLHRVWKDLGVEDDQNWLDRPSEEWNLTEYQKGLATLLSTP